MHPITLEVRLHGSLVRGFYRFVAPRSARGWLDFHAVVETDDRLWVHTHGMPRWSLPDIELFGVPRDLRGFAHGLLMEIIDYMKTTQSVMKAGENFGIGTSGPPLLGTLRAVDRAGDPEHADHLRIVDVGQETGGGDHSRLLSMWLTASVANERDPKKAEPVLRRAIELFPGRALKDGEGIDLETDEVSPSEVQNIANVWARDLHAEALWALGRTEEANQAIKAAVELAPVWAADFAKSVREAPEPPPPGHPYRVFLEA